MEKDNIKIDLQDDGDVKRMLSSLGRVDAPNDFTFRVKARIAEQKAASEHRGWAPAFLRIAAPAAVTVAVATGGYFALIDNGQAPLPVAAVEETMEFAPPQSAEVADAGPSVGSDIGEPSIPVSNAFADAKPAPAPQRAQARESRPAANTNEGGGSTVRAAKPPAAPLLPRGIDPQTVIPNTRPGDAAGTHRISDILQMIGVNAQRGAMGWNVSGTTSAGVGGRAGIRSGDIVVAIDGTPINNTDTIKGTATIRSLQLIREGRRVTITFGR
ncbi:MAG TPA: hypothetical protein VK918_07185 [Pyrinomonadaceae bacterium]|nr:hypothetical protein [Pyrinomonadaceae bacterium]